MPSEQDKLVYEQYFRAVEDKKLEKPFSSPWVEELRVKELARRRAERGKG